MTEFKSIPLPVAVLILIVLALSFAWSFRLAYKLDRLQEEFDEVWKELEKKEFWSRYD